MTKVKNEKIDRAKKFLSLWKTSTRANVAADLAIESENKNYKRNYFTIHQRRQSYILFLFRFN